MLAYIPDDKELALSDVQGKSVMELPDSSNMVIGVKTVLEKTGLI